MNELIRKLADKAIYSSFSRRTPETSSSASADRGRTIGISPNQRGVSRLPDIADRKGAQFVRFATRSKFDVTRWRPGFIPGVGRDGGIIKNGAIVFAYAERRAQSTLITRKDFAAYEVMGPSICAAILIAWRPRDRRVASKGGAS